MSTTDRNTDGKEQNGIYSSIYAILPADHRWFFAWMLIGTLLGGIALGIVAALYITPHHTSSTSTTTTTTTTTTITTTTTSTSSSSSTTSSTSMTSTTMPPLVPSGVILLWSGSSATVPYGWAICDGTQGTPDLRNRFIIGSGASALYSPNQTGGSSSKTATITVYDTTLTLAQIPAHNHGGSTGVEDLGSIYYDVYTATCSAVPMNYAPPRWINTKSFNECADCQHRHPITSEGGNQPHTHAAAMTPIDTTPPFIALLYIMKL